MQPSPVTVSDQPCTQQNDGEVVCIAPKRRKPTRGQLAMAQQARDHLAAERNGRPGAWAERVR